MNSILSNTGAYPSDFSEAYNKCLWRFAVNAAPQLYDLYLKSSDSDTCNLLDLCCGPGQLCCFFLENGFTITGIDLSEKMLELAKENSKCYQEKSEWLLLDASHFELNRSFGVVFSTFSSLNLLPSFEHLISCFECVYNHLERNGLFVFDITTKVGADSHNNNFFRDTEDYTIILNGFYNKSFSPGKASLNFLGFFKIEESIYKKFEHYQTEIIFEIAQIETALKHIGFYDIEYFIYGATSIQPVLEPELFPNVIIKARK